MTPIPGTPIDDDPTDDEQDPEQIPTTDDDDADDEEDGCLLDDDDTEIIGDNAFLRDMAKGNPFVKPPTYCPECGDEMHLCSNCASGKVRKAQEYQGTGEP